ncbi:MAG: ATP-binding protein [Saprospiraceae bacterium]
MKTTLEQLKSYLEKLALNQGQQDQLSSFIHALDQEVKRQEFMLRRTFKDKEITTNLLNQTIDDLKRQKHYIEENNQALSEHKKRIEDINTQLIQQKILLERQSAELEDHLHQLKIAYKELEQFSYIASHDLRSPLRTITSYAQLLQHRFEGKLNKEGDEFLQFVVDGAKQMSHVLEDLLEYAQAGGRTRQLVNTDIKKVVELIRFNLKAEIEQTQTLIEVGDLPEVQVLRSSMLQVLQNLVANAIKFKSETPPRIQINCIREKEYWHFSVADNGIGLDERFQEKIFEPFQRLNTVEAKGTGMGLAICKKLVNLHYGTIWYHSQPHQGTVFHFTIAAHEK